jgi:cytochrome bd-type quinol oxidase subunit 2
MTELNNTSATKKHKMSKARIFWLTLGAGLLLLIANSAFWLNHNIFNEQRFAEITTDSLTSETSRTAIASALTDRIYEDRPIASRIAGDLTKKTISGLLDSSLVETAIKTTAERLNLAVTASNKESVEIDLSGVKDVVTQVVNVASTINPELQADPSNIPESIVLLDGSRIPDFYKYGIAFMWLAPLAFLGAMVLLALPYTRKTNGYISTALLQSSVFTAVAAFALLMGPLLRPPFLSVASTVHGKVVIGNLYDSFMATYNTQTLTLLTVALLLNLALGAFYLYPILRKTKQAKSSKE